MGTAFETPTFTQFADPSGDGGFNPDLEPQKALNREIGVRGRAGNRVRYDLALYSVRVRDEILPFENANSPPTFYENAGLTRREGLEAGIDWIATDNFTLAAAYTYSDYRFARFVDHGTDVSGNRLPGIPQHHLYLEGDWQWVDGHYASVSTRYVGPVYADNENDVEVDDFTVVDARIGRRLGVAGQRRLEIFFGVDNVFDEKYIANVRVNMASGYFEPAPERTWIVGLETGF